MTVMMSLIHELTKLLSCVCHQITCLMTIMLSLFIIIIIFSLIIILSDMLLWKILSAKDDQSHWHTHTHKHTHTHYDYPHSLNYYLFAPKFTECGSVSVTFTQNPLKLTHIFKTTKQDDDRICLKNWLKTGII